MVKVEGEPKLVQVRHVSCNGWAVLVKGGSQGAVSVHFSAVNDQSEKLYNHGEGP